MDYVYVRRSGCSLAPVLMTFLTFFTGCFMNVSGQLMLVYNISWYHYCIILPITHRTELIVFLVVISGRQLPTPDLCVPSSWPPQHSESCLVFRAIIHCHSFLRCHHSVTALLCCHEVSSLGAQLYLPMPCHCNLCVWGFDCGTFERNDLKISCQENVTRYRYYFSIKLSNENIFSEHLRPC